MRTRKTPKTQLALEWTEAMRWEDFSAPVRERVRELLAALLRQAAGRAARPPEERGDDE
jgi:hypothetical protein